jgi:hypothetical protein
MVWMRLNFDPIVFAVAVSSVITAILCINSLFSPIPPVKYLRGKDGLVFINIGLGLALLAPLTATALLVTFTGLIGVTLYQTLRKDIMHPLVLVSGIFAYFIVIPGAYLLFTGFQSIPAEFHLSHPMWALVVALIIMLVIYVITLVTFQFGFGFNGIRDLDIKLSFSSLRSILWPRFVPDSRSQPQSMERGERTDLIIDYLDSVNPGVLFCLGLAGFSAGLLTYSGYVWINGGPMHMLTVAERTAVQTVPNTYRFRILGLAGLFGGWTTILCALRPLLERRGHEKRSSTRLHQHRSQSSYTQTRLFGGTFSDLKNITSFIRSPSAWAGMTLILTSAIVLVAAVLTRARMVILVPALILLIYLHTAEWLPQRALLTIGTLVFFVGVTFSAIEKILLGYPLSATISPLLHGFVQTRRLALLMVVLVRVPFEFPFQYGATLLDAVYIDIPGFPRYGNYLEIIAYGVEKENRTLSAMLPGELWLNLGPIGILIGGVVYGLALRWIYRFQHVAAPLLRGIYPMALVCVLLLLPSNLTWGIPNLFFRVLAPVIVAIVATLLIQRRFPSIAHTLYDRMGISE